MFEKHNQDDMMQLGRSKVVERESCRKCKSLVESLKVISKELNVASFTVVDANTVAWKYCNNKGDTFVQVDS